MPVAFWWAALSTAWAPYASPLCMSTNSSRRGASISSKALVT